MLRADQERDGLVTPLWGRDKLLDTGNYVFHPLKAYAYLIEEAREVGDDAAAEAAWEEVQQRIDMKIDDRGWLIVDGASMASHLALARSLNGRKSGWLDLITRGMPDAWRDGPQIESVPYPAVMVSRRSTTARRSTRSSARPTAAGASTSSCRSCGRTASTT